MDSADDEQEEPAERPERPPIEEPDPAFAAAVFRARLHVLVIGSIALAGIVIMCLIVGLLILRER